MAIVAESFMVVMQTTAVEQHWPDGVEGLRRDSPNSTFCTDGLLCKVSFMIREDARAWMGRLADHGFNLPTAEGAPEVTLFDDRNGSAFPCDWLHHGTLPIPDPDNAEVTHDVPAIRHRDDATRRLVAPAGFRPGAVSWVSGEVLSDYDLVDEDDGVQTWKHRDTGELRYTARAPVLDGQRVQEAVADLRKRVWSLAEPHDGPLTPEETLVLEGCIARALELEAVMEHPSDVLLLRGVVYRRLARWEEAAAAFRTLTQLQPRFLGGWLDLTWALSSLKRFDEAEASARTAVELAPEDAASLGNLAATLMEQHKDDEALSVIERALAIAPQDPQNRHIASVLRKRQPPPKPWWRRLLGS